jgi:hypothetical protein
MALLRPTGGGAGGLDLAVVGMGAETDDAQLPIVRGHDHTLDGCGDGKSERERQSETGEQAGVRRWRLHADPFHEMRAFSSVKVGDATDSARFFPGSQ